MIAVWFSNGAASAIALKLTLDEYGKDNVRAVNNPVAEEDLDNLRFQRDVSDWLGIEIEAATHPNYPNASAVEVWDRRKAMAFPHGAPCTIHLKKEARQHWEQTNKPDDGGDADPCLIDQLEAVEGLIKREAAALRGETP